MKLLGLIVDSWGTFFGEAFTPRTRALRADMVIIVWPPIIGFFLIKYIAQFIHTLNTKMSSSTKAGISDSTRSVKELANASTPLQTIEPWLIGIGGVFLLAAVLSLIIRRIHDTGVPMYIAFILTWVLVGGLLYALYPVWSPYLNTLQTWVTLPKASLPYATTKNALVYGALVYLLLQITPSNLFASKKIKKYHLV